MLLTSDVIEAHAAGGDLGGLTLVAAVQWLKAHQVLYVYAADWVEVLDVERGEDGAYRPIWTECPRTYRELLTWLGY